MKNGTQAGRRRGEGELGPGRLRTGLAGECLVSEKVSDGIEGGVVINVLSSYYKYKKNHLNGASNCLALKFRRHSVKSRQIISMRDL